MPQEDTANRGDQTPYYGNPDGQGYFYQRLHIITRPHRVPLEIARFTTQSAERRQYSRTDGCREGAKRRPVEWDLPGRAIQRRWQRGIARVAYVTVNLRRVVARALVKKTEKTPRREIDLALRRARELLQ